MTSVAPQFELLGPPVARQAIVPRPSTGAAARRLGVLPMPTLEYTDEVARETAHLYERVKTVIPAIEWPVMAPYVKAINDLKKVRNAVILAHNYQTPEIFHCVADIVGDSLQLARRGDQDRRRRHRPVRRPLHGRDLEAAQPGQAGADPGHARRLLARRLDHRRRRAAAARALSRRAGRHLRQHLRRREGGERHLLHLVQRRRRWSRASASTGSSSCPTSIWPSGSPRRPRSRSSPGTAPARCTSASPARSSASYREANPGVADPGASGVPARRARRGRLHRLDLAR